MGDPCRCAGRRELAVVRLSALRLSFSCQCQRHAPELLCLSFASAEVLPSPCVLYLNNKNLQSTCDAACDSPLSLTQTVGLSRVNTASFHPLSITTHLERLQEVYRSKDAGRADTTELYSEVQDRVALLAGHLHLHSRMFDNCRHDEGRHWRPDKVLLCYGEFRP